MKVFFIILGFFLFFGVQGITLAQETPYLPNIRDNRLLKKAEKSFDLFAKEGKKELIVGIIGTLKTQLGILRDPKSQYILFELGRIAEEQLPLAIAVASEQQKANEQLIDQNTGATTIPSLTGKEELPTTSPGTSTLTGDNTSLSLLEHGKASYYGDGFKSTANGEKFNNDALTAAHKTLPFNTRVKVINKKNDLRVIVRINDRGPFTPGRVIDLTQSAFKAINNDSLSAGVLDVTLEIIEEEK